MSDVRILKLISGEEVVGVVDRDGGTHDILKSNEFFVLKPIAVAYLPDEQTGQVKPSLVPWAMHVQGNRVKLKDEHVIFNELAREDLAGAYNQATGRVMTPPKGIIVPGGKR